MLSFYDIVGFSDHPANLSSADRLLCIGIIAAICLLAYFLLKKIVFPLVKRFTEKTDATWDERFAVICLIVAVAGLGLAPWWISNMIGDSVLPVVSQLMR